MKLDKHISTLLYNYDCVIVPELGGFVCNYKPAQIHHIQNTLIPPQKNVVFNSNLKNNDGLLIHHVSVEEQITYTNANTIVQQYVQHALQQLNSGKKVAIDEVGTLSYDVEHNIQFSPEEKTNFLLDVYGMTTIVSPAIKREGHVKRLEKEFKDRIIPIEQKQNATKRKINMRRMVALALLAPVIFAALWIPLKTDFLKTGNVASLNPFAIKETPLYKHNVKIVPLYENKTETIVENNSVITLTESSQRKIVIQPKSENNVAPIDNTDVKKTAQPVTIKSTPGAYYIIGGCFEIYDNATRFAETLRSKGFNAAILDKNLGKLHPVAYSVYSNKEDAVSALEQIRLQDTNAWLLSY